MLSIIKHNPNNSSISATNFYLGIIRLEKRTILTFTSKLYQDEERRLRGMYDTKDPFVPDFGLKQAVTAAIFDPECELEAAKNLLKQMQAKVSELETRLGDYEDTSVSISPAQMPQAQAAPKDMWTRFRRCLPSFMDVVMDTAASISDTTYLTMSDDVQKKVISD